MCHKVHLIVYKEIDLMNIADDYQIEIRENNSDHELDNLIKFKIKSYLMYLKYINNGSELEINISYRQKQRLKNKIANLNDLMNMKVDAHGMFILYNDVIYELGKLLKSSHHRFKMQRK